MVGIFCDIFISFFFAKKKKRTYFQTNHQAKANIPTLSLENSWKVVSAMHASLAMRFTRILFKATACKGFKEAGQSSSIAPARLAARQLDEFHAVCVQRLSLLGFLSSPASTLHRQDARRLRCLDHTLYLAARIEQHRSLGWAGWTAC